MPIVNVIQQNWVGGELSPNMRGRFDLPIYASGAEKMQNFIAEATGGARFRTGTSYVNNTRRNNVACLIPFQFNSEQSYLLEFTEGYIRFHRNNGVLVTGDKTITGATKANPCVVTAVGHGYSTGDEVIISGISGMTQLNNRSFVITVLTADTFSLQDQFGSNINSTNYTTYSSGGIAQKIYEITSPYQEEDLFALKVGQNADTMYIVHRYYEPRKLTRTGATSWTLALFSRTDDPFLTKKTITGITQANPAVVTTSAAHGYSSGMQVIIEGVVGMTQVNSRRYVITVTAADAFSLANPDGTPVDSSAYTAWSSDGYASNQDLLPAAFAFYQGRAYYGYSDAYTQSIWGSKALDSSGNPQYDVMTVGTNAADGFKFTLSPSTGRVDKIQALIPTSSFLGIATFEGISKADGGSDGAAITPSNIRVVPAGTFGVAQQITPILNGSSLLFIHRSNLILFSLEFDIITNSYNAVDKTLTDEHITSSGITQMVFINSRPPLLWLVRNDGVLVGITYLSKENINGAHRQLIGGIDAKVLSVGGMPRDNAYDQTWIVAERTINGHTVRYVEYFNDVIEIPELDDSYTDEDAQTDDDDAWRNRMFEAQKQAIHCDAAATYDGSLYGSEAGVSVTPGSTAIGTGVTFTASGAIFTSSMVGREIWKKSVDGVGSGRAIITAYVNSTHVTCQITSAFDSTDVMAAGNWYLTTAAPTGLWHLEGQSVIPVTDGGVHAAVTVSSGSITLQYQASVIQIGLTYTGLVKSMALEAGGQNGVAQTKPKNINHMDLRFLNTLGARFGSSLYDMEEIPFRLPSDSAGRPAPLFTGVKPVYFEDTTERDKHVYIQQINPLPCCVLCAVPFVDTDNAG